MSDEEWLTLGYFLQPYGTKMIFKNHKHSRKWVLHIQEILINGQIRSMEYRRSLLSVSKSNGKAFDCYSICLSKLL